MGIVDPVLGLTDEDIEEYRILKKTKGRRDARVCICGHSGGAHFMLSGFGGEENIARNPKGSMGCQAGRVPCACSKFDPVLKANDVRSFIHKTEGPGRMHALMKGVKSSRERGVTIEWRPDLRCYRCAKAPDEVGQILPVDYNERNGEALRSTPNSALVCDACRMAIQSSTQ